MSVYNITGEQVCPEDLSGLEYLRSDRTLIWHEEFNDERINEDKWGHLIGGYKADVQRYYMYEDVSKNAYINNGILHITNLRNYPTSQIDFSGAFIDTHGKFEWKYGLLESRIKFPNAPAYHGTLWTLSSNYNPVYNQEMVGMTPTHERFGGNYGEMDIAECDQQNVSCAFHSVATDSFGGYNMGSGTNWHIYGIEWTSTGANVYLDRNLVKHVDWNVAELSGYQNPFQKSHYVILNMNPWLFNESAQTEDFLEIEIDWIRVYAPLGVSGAEDTETSITLSATNINLSVGDFYELIPTFVPTTVVNQTLKWESYNNDIVTVCGGDVKAVGTGTTYIRALSKNGCTAYCKVTVS